MFDLHRLGILFGCISGTGTDEDLCRFLPEEPGLMPATALLLPSSHAAVLSPPEWLQAWNPQLVLHGMASGDRRVRPAPEVLQAVQGRILLRSDQNRWVKLTTDGEQLWVEVEILVTAEEKSIGNIISSIYSQVKAIKLKRVSYSNVG